MTASLTRLQSQHQRLYRSRVEGGLAPADAPGRVRVLVIELARPADWAALGAVWRGVQQDLEWPAPGIAVNGADALALWFSLAEPVALDQAAALLGALCQRYLPDVKPARLRLFPAVAGGAAPPSLPPQQTSEERWSAFVAPDLAAVFADDPALDMPPGEDAQADLLSRLASIPPTAFQAAQAQLLPPAVASTEVAAPVAGAVQPAAAPLAPPAPDGLDGPFEDPQAFLLAVMNDTRVPLAQRMQAARFLLQAAAGAVD